MEMLCVYYKTLWRDVASGRCRFMVTPSEKNSLTKDGMVMCEGVIPAYGKQTPLKLEGHAEGRIFMAEKSSLVAAGDSILYLILDSYFSDMSESKKKKVVEAMHPDTDLFETVRAMGQNTSILAQFLKKAGVEHPEDTAAEIAARVGLLLENERTAKMLLRYHVPLSRVETVIRKGITVRSIRQNPYRCFAECDIPIMSADQTAHEIAGVDSYNPARLCEYTADGMRTLQKLGDTCAEIETLTRSAAFSFAKRSVSSIVMNRYITEYAIAQMPGLFSVHDINDVPYVYFQYMWEAESEAVRNMERLQRPDVRYDACLTCDDVEKITGLRYNSGQRKAFEMIRTSGVKVLTGPPGSGKTAVLNGLLEAFSACPGKSYHLAATTGMAAKVMSRATGRDAETVNMMLNIVPYEKEVQGRDLSDPVDADLIIVDEVSMLDLQMFSALLKGIRSGSILILVGDEDQLQSVGAGNVLHDLIASGICETYRLTEVMRQSGTICDNARLINRGCISELRTDETYKVFRCKSDQEAMEALKRNYRRSEGTQILCPIRKGPLSVASIAKAFEDDTAEPAAVYGSTVYRIGSKIVMTRTDYEAGYTNGDMGYITDADAEGETFTVRFSDREMEMGRSFLSDMAPAEAITIHKSQGNEFEEVHIVLPEEALHMMTRRIIYTAVTRARRKVIIYSVNGAYEHAVENAGERRKRTTKLRERLEDAKNSVKGQH